MDPSLPFMTGNPTSWPTFDLVLPCYNPAAGWVDRVLAAWNRLPILIGKQPDRLILVNDGSTKGIAKDDIQRLRAGIPQLHYIEHYPNRGKGHALRQGVEASTADVVVYTDVDFPYLEESLAEVALKLMHDEADVVPGVRPDAYYDGVPADRRRISRMLRWMLKRILKLKITDTQCGLKGFNAKGRAVFLRTGIDRFLFDLEFIFLASKTPNLRIEPVPVTLKPGIQFSHVSTKVLLAETVNFGRVFLRALRGK